MSVKKLKTGYLVDVYDRKEDGREARLSVECQIIL